MSRTKKITEPHYELLYIVSNKYTEQETAPIAEKIKTLIKESKGEITYTEDWGKKKLAYAINHFNHGYYFLIEFDLAGAKMNWVDTEIKHMSEVLRHQIVSKKKRSLEEIEDENRILKKQAKRAAEKKAEAEAEALKPTGPTKKTSSYAKKDSKVEESKIEQKKEEKPTEDKVNAEGREGGLGQKEEVKEIKSKEEVKLNLDKLDEKLDKILDTDDLL